MMVMVMMSTDDGDIYMMMIMNVIVKDDGDNDE